MSALTETDRLAHLDAPSTTGDIVDVLREHVAVVVRSKPDRSGAVKNQRACQACALPFAWAENDYVDQVRLHQAHEISRIFAADALRLDRVRALHEQWRDESTSRGVDDTLITEGVVARLDAALAAEARLDRDREVR